MSCPVGSKKRSRISKICSEPTYRLDIQRTRWMILEDSSPAKIGFIGSSRMMVTAILDCFTAKTAIDQAVLIQMIALVAGYALVALFSLMGNLSYLSILHLLIFQLVWAIIGTVIPNLKKY